jgi:nucleotide-binding universal stress UspA family protein
MFNKILVPIDYSDASKALFDTALKLAKATQSQLMLLHVLSADEEGSPGLPMYPQLTYSPSLDETVWEVYRERWEAYENKHLEQLKRYAEGAEAQGVQAEITQTPGMPGKVICDLAKTWGADLILMGSRGRSGLSELLLGSVSNYVTHHATCSVMLLRNGSHSAPTTSE